MSILDTIINTLVAYQWWIAAAALVAIVAVIFRPSSQTVKKPVAVATPANKTDGIPGDIRIGPKAAVALWPLLTLLVACGIVGILFTFDRVVAWYFEIPAMMNIWFAAAFVVAAAYTFGQRESETLKVPETAALPLTFIGSSTFFGRGLLLTEGVFAWWGSRLLFAPWDLTGRKGIEDFVVKAMIGGAERWFFSTIAMPLKIWNSGHEKGVERISVNSKNGVELDVTLTLDIIFRTIGAALASGNLVLTIAERARTTLRTAAGFFTALDIAVVKDLLQKLVMGETIVTCFLTKEVRNFTPGSIVRDLGGEPQLKVVVRKIKDDGTLESQDEAVERTAIEFNYFLKKNGISEKMAEAIKDEGGNIIVEERRVTDPLAPILARVGAQLLSAAVGIVKLPPEVINIAKAMEIQAGEKHVQISSAEAAKDAARILRPDRDEAADGRHFDRVVLAKVMDPGYKGTAARFIHLSGSSGPGNLNTAAAILAAGKEKD